jgi:uncharacterized protein
MKNLKLVIDTNILLVSISPIGKYHWLYQSLANQRIDLLVSNEIVFEYYEVLGRKYPKMLIEQLLDPVLSFTNVTFINPTFHWNLIRNDEDDNKFVDCAIAGNADLILSNDADFRVLKTIEFPRVNLLTIEEFEAQFKQHLTT